MTDVTVVAIVTVIPATITAFVTLIVTVMNAKKTDAVAAKVDVVHTLANDQLSKLTTALAVEIEKNKGLELLNASLSGRSQIPAQTPPPQVGRPPAQQERL